MFANNHAFILNVYDLGSCGTLFFHGFTYSMNLTMFMHFFEYSMKFQSRFESFYEFFVDLLFIMPRH